MPELAAMDGRGSSTTPPHFVLVPLFAPGHIIPMADIAHLLADRGVTVSLVTTPLNTTRIRAAIDRAEASGLPIRFVELPFPCARFGLPEGCESAELLPSRDDAFRFFQGLVSLKEPLGAYLRRQRPPPSCIISDMCHPWTRALAEEFGVPRLVFHGISAFALLCEHNIRRHGVYETLDDDMRPFVVPGLPHPVEVTRAQAPGFFQAPGLEKHRSEVIAADETSDGVVLNSFYDLEPSYVDSYRAVTGKKVWAIGPVCLYNNRDLADRAARGNTPSIDSTWCLRWLDGMKPGSVVFVSFGSLARTAPSQVVEIGMGLEAAGHPFLWVIKATEQDLPQIEKWLLEEGFHERTKERAIVIRGGWAPQMAILSHPAVGGFVSHCGWNSSLEAISAGVPMVTWPHFAEQFLNERLVVEVLGVGVPVGVKRQTKWKIEEEGEVVRREVVEAAVRKVMDGGAEAEERSERARSLGEKARTAMAVGGSSHESMTRLICDMSVSSSSSR